jgi:DNA-binding MarR family transcriptional regulator
MRLAKKDDAETAPGRKARTSSKGGALAQSNESAISLKLEDNFSYRLSILNFLMGKATQKIYGAQDLTAPQWKVLSVIDRWGPIPASQISIWVTLDKTAISRAVRQLYDHGLVVWIPHGTDMRSVQILLTPKGRRVYAEMNELVAHLQRRLFANASEERIRMLFAMIGAIEEILRSDLGKPATPRRKTEKTPRT